MDSRFGFQRGLIAVGAALTLLGSGCGLMAPKSERYPPPQAGTTWTTMVRDSGSYGSGSAQLTGRFLPDRMWQGKEVHAFEFGGLTTLMTQSDANFIVQLKGETPTLTWDPPVGWLWPLEVGKTWTRKSTLTIHAAKRAVDYEYTQTVEAYEDVTVPAGTYKTFRVKTTSTLGDENVVWWSPDLGLFIRSRLARTAKNALGPGTRETELVSYARSGK
jgi:hypothetical protein